MDQNVYAEGSGSITSDRDGNPEIKPGATVLIGRHRRITPVMAYQDETNWDEGMDVFVGRRCKVASTHPADDQEACRTFTVVGDGDGMSPRACGTSYEFRCRDAILLLTAEGAKTRYEIALEEARCNRKQFEVTYIQRRWLLSWARNTGLVDDLGDLCADVLDRMTTLFFYDGHPEKTRADALERMSLIRSRPEERRCSSCERVVPETLSLFEHNSHLVCGDCMSEVDRRLSPPKHDDFRIIAITETQIVTQENGVYSIHQPIVKKPVGTVAVGDLLKWIRRPGV